MVNQTVLIGLDGATFTILDPLMEEGIMPFLKEFVASGTRGELRSVVPPLTPPAWTSLVTGRSPGNHGVFDFFRPVSADSPYMQVTTSHDVHAETIWSIASRYGLKVASLNFPLMFPPPIINGYVVPGGWMPWRQLRLGCYPSDLYDRLKSLPGFNARELAMDPALEAKAIEGCSQDEYEDWIELHIRREQHWAEILRHLMAHDPCELTGILFDGVDKLQHLCWRFLDPACLSNSPSRWEQRIRELCLQYFRQLDELLAEVVAMSDRDANIAIVSDHGFGATMEVFYVNNWLQQHGYLTWADDQVFQEQQPEELGIRMVARYSYLVDRDRTTAYATTPSSNGIHIVMADGHHSPGVPGEDYHRFRDQLMTSLRRFNDRESSEPVVSRIWTREEAFAGPYQSFAPDLTLALRDGGQVSILPSDVPLKRRREPKGTHRPQGVFIAGGRGVRPGVILPQLSILDVAPVLLYCLGLPIPDDLEGHLPTGMFDQSMLRKQPVRNRRPTEPMEAAQGDAPESLTLSPEDEASIVERLRTLGYIE